MGAFGSNPGEKFAKRALVDFFQKAVAPEVTNADYEGEISAGGGDRLNILSFSRGTIQNYTGAAMTPDTPDEIESQLVVDQKKAYYFKIESVAKFISYIDDPSNTLINMYNAQLREVVDTFVLGFYGDVAAGNRYGTDYTTGTVAITAVTGAVTGTGTTFTAAMVGRGFKAAGHTKWYRVKTYTSATAIVIEDDFDDVASAYTGGTISAGATYTIEAATKLQISKTTVYAMALALGERLDEAKAPKEDRWMVIPSKIASVFKQAPELIPAVNMAYEGVVLNGLIGKINGIIVYENELVTGNNTDGYHILAGHKSFLTFGMAFKESGTEDLIGAFGMAYKGLAVYGAKVADSRRKAGAEAFVYV